ncbi:MAG: glycosyltransferase family 2 protein [Lachnospiraceae bacterium]|nr:glycosyltransferase family 2 protein [Lachnospiraceae bacterium]
MISVIVPVYNKEEYLGRCIDSVLKQSYADLELILVDDGSKDGSAGICREYEKKDKRVRFFSKENGGASSARNLGIEKALGEYIGFVDGDDWIENDMYETLFNELAKHRDEKNRPHVAQLMSVDHAPDLTLIKDADQNDGSVKLKKRDDYFRELIMHTGDSSFCTKLFDAEFIKGYKFPEGKKNEDFALLVEMMPGLEAGIITIGKTGYHIYHSEESATRGSYDQKLYEDMMYNAFGAYRYARDHYPEYITEAARFRLVQAYDFLLHIPVERMTADNAFYMRIVRFVKSEMNEIKKNPYLKKKERLGLTLLSISPRGIRSAHRSWMKVRDR